MKDNTFLGLTFQQFADINAIGIVLLVVFSFSIFLFSFYPHKYIKNNFYIFFQKYFKYLYINRLLLFILLIAVVGANVYERVYGDAPCEFCWYQRILIYPMLILSVAESFFNTRAVHKFIGVFAAMTLILSSYHYYFHFKRYVMNDILSMPCTSNSLMPNCGEAGVISFGFVTMPLLSVCMSLSVLIFVIVMNRLNKQG